MGSVIQLDNRQLTDREAAEHSGQSTRTVRRWRESGLLPFYRVGRSARIRKSDLDVFLERHRVESAIPANAFKAKVKEISDRVLRERHKHPDLQRKLEWGRT